jgi:hypothetical protein
MSDGMYQFVRGALAMACWVAGLFFLRYFRQSRDRLFCFFSVAFWIFSLNWLALAVLNPGVESRHYVMLVRVVAFLLILFAIVDKNRRSRAG